MLASTAAMATEVTVSTGAEPMMHHTGTRTTVIRHDNGMHRGFDHSRHYGYRSVEHTGTVSRCSTKTIRKTNDMGQTVTKRISSC